MGASALLVKSPGAPLSAVVALTGLTAVFSQFFSPAFAASLANIVRKDDMPRASGLLQVTNTLGQVVGPLLGGSARCWCPVIAVKIWLANSVQFGALEAAFPLGFALGAGLFTVLAHKEKRRGLVHGDRSAQPDLSGDAAVGGAPGGAGADVRQHREPRQPCHPDRFHARSFPVRPVHPIPISVGAGVLLVLTMLGSFILTPQIRNYR